MYRKGIGEKPSPLFSAPAGSGAASDSFKTIACPSGTNPVADSATDTLTLAAGAGITITGDSATDTITLASTSAVIPAGTATYDHLEWNGSAWVNVANMTMATAASLSWNSTSVSMTTSGGTFVLTTNNVFGGSVVAGTQVFSWVSGSVKLPGTNTLKFGGGSNEYIYSSGANALDLNSTENMHLRIGGTIEATLTSSGMLMAGTNYVAFNAATEKIYGGGSGTLVYDATNYHIFAASSVTEATLGANLISFANGALGTYLNWNASGVLGIGIDCASPALTNFEHFKFSTTVFGDNVYSNLLFRAYSFDLEIGTSKDVAYFQSRYSEISDTDNFYFFLDGSEALSFQKTSAGVLTSSLLGSAFSFSSVKMLMTNSVNTGHINLDSGGNMELRCNAASTSMTWKVGSGGSPLSLTFTAAKLQFGNATSMNIGYDTASSCSLTLNNIGAGAMTVHLISSSDWSFNSSTLTIGDANNIVINTTTGTKIGTGITQKIGFWNATPVIQSTGYAITNKTSDKTLDCNATSIDELADVLGTLIDDLKTYGILGA